MTPLSRARLIAVMTPTVLLGGALGSQYLGHLVPCEMCLWQRWPHLLAILLALSAILQRSWQPLSRWMTLFAALAILVSGALGIFHVGVEQHWWRGPNACTSIIAAGSTRDVMAQIMATPLVRCDQPQWALSGISLAGWNAIVSIGAGIAILLLLRRRA